MARLESVLSIGVNDRATAPLRRLGGSLDRFAQRQRTIAAGMIPGGNLRTLIGAVAGYQAVTGAFRGTVGAAIEFESAMAEVKKVVDTTPAGFAKLETSVVNMSKRIPMATSGLAEIMASAGAAGLAAEDLARHTEFAAKAATAFDMAASETGDVLIKLRTVFGLTQDGVEDLADSANHLSNNFAARAGEILNFTNRAAGAAQTLNMSYAELSATGAAMVASGIIPETAARGVNAMATRLAVGGPKIEGAFNAMGWSFSEWQKLRKENGPRAMQKMFEELSKLDADGASSALADLVGRDFSDDFGKLLQRPEVLAEAFSEVADEARRAGSVQDEYAARADTAANKIQLLKNNIAALGIEIGGLMSGGLGDFAQRLANNIGSVTERTDNLFRRIQRGYRGLAEGLGLDDEGGLFGGLKDQLRDLETFVFGYDLSDLSVTERLLAEGAGSARLSDITDQFRALGEAIRGVVGGDLSQLDDLAESFGKVVERVGAMGGAATAAGIAAVAALGRALMALGIGLMTSRIGRIVAVTTAIVELVEALSKGEGLGQAISNMDMLTKALTAFGVAVAWFQAIKLGKGIVGLFGGKGKGAGGAPGAPSSGKPNLLQRLLSGRMGKTALVGAGIGGVGYTLFGGGEAEAKPNVAGVGAAGFVGSGLATGTREAVDGLRAVRGGYINEAGEFLTKGAVAAQRDQIVPDAFSAMGAGRLTVGEIDKDLPALARIVKWAKGEGFEPRGEDESSLSFGARHMGRQMLSGLFQATNWLGPGKLGWGVTGADYASGLMKDVQPVAPERQWGGDSATSQIASELAALRDVTHGRRGRPEPVSSEGAQYNDHVVRVVADGVYSAMDQLRAVNQNAGEHDATGMGGQARELASGLTGAVNDMRRMLMDATGRAGGINPNAAPPGIGSTWSVGAPSTAEVAQASSEVRTALTEGGQSGGEGMAQGVQSGVEQAASAVMSLASRVTSALAGLGSLLFGSGAQAVQQLAAGMRSQQATVAAAANEIANSVAARFPQSPAKIGPLRNLPQMGSKIVQQLAGGMSPGPAGLAASGVAAALAAGMAVGAGPASAAGSLEGAAAGGAPVVNMTVTINVSGAESPQKVADDIGRRLGDAVASSLRARFSDGPV